MITELISLIRLIIKIFGTLAKVEQGAFIKVLTNTAKSFGVKALKQAGISEVQQVKRTAERLLNTKKVKYVEAFEKQIGKLLPKDMNVVNKVIHNTLQGQKAKVPGMIPGTPLKIMDIVFVKSSWIDWIAWRPMSSNQMYGTLWIRVKHASLQNPGGIYQFPKPSHPHGYGPHVNRNVFIFMSWALGAGKVFWEMFYRAWYNTHRRIGYYGLEYRKRPGDTGKRYYLKGTNIRYTKDKISTYYKK